MKESASYQDGLAALKSTTGVVIPIYLPPAVDFTFAHSLISGTTRAFLREVENPKAIVLAVDGAGPGVAAGAAVAEELRVQCVFCERNKGKLYAARLGMKKLLENVDVKHAAIIDQDGDHFANELLNLLRASLHVEQAAQTDKVMVLGRRISRHRGMGFLRGELEELADRMLLDALEYDAAITGQPLRLQFATTIEEFPDFHSGYKLFTRPTAEAVFLSDPIIAGASEDAYYRHGCEAVMSLEAIKSGAYMAIVNRSAFDEQPVSAFGLLNRQRMVSDKIVWPCKRLNIPPAFVAQWMSNHLPRLLLGTHAPEGKEELAEIRSLVLRAFGIAPPEEPTIQRPRFI